jgi:Tol biopolymer transport system component
MKARNLLKALIFIPLIFSCDHSVDPVWIDYHNKILFTSGRNGIPQLYMMNPDGTDIKQITSGQYSHSNGRWSPDALKIVCNTDENITTAGMQMLIMNSDGTNRRLIGMGSQMSWSPDGKQIAFMLWPSAELGDLTTYIYKISSDGTNSIQLTNNKGVWDGTPDWSPDGKLIAFASSRDYSSPGTFSEIYIMNLDGSDQHRLTLTDSLVNTNPTWSPDGTKIAFSCNGLIALMSSNGTEIKILDSLSTGGLISWSPDGNRLAFGAGQVCTIKVDGSDIKTILTDSDVWGVDWSK